MVLLKLVNCHEPIVALADPFELFLQRFGILQDVFDLGQSRFGLLRFLSFYNLFHVLDIEIIHSPSKRINIVFSARLINFGNVHDWVLSQIYATDIDFAFVEVCLV